MTSQRPTVGDDIYVGSSYYIDHGEDDFEGGLCEISNVTTGTSGGRQVYFVEIKERPGHSYNYEVLLEQQENLAETYGDQRGFENPDYESY